jgi:ankyrin repeat protein
MSFIWANVLSGDNMDILKRVLESGVGINYLDTQGLTAINSAVRTGRTKCFLFLLDCKADIHFLDWMGRSILHYSVNAVCLGRENVRITRILLKHGAMRYLNFKDKHGETPIDWTLTNKHPECTELLLDVGTKMTPRCEETPWVRDLIEKRRVFRQSYAVAYGLIRIRIKVGKDMTGVISSMIYASRFDESWGK